VADKFSPLQACLLSLIAFSGASQFAVIGVLANGGSAVSGIVAATLLGFRNTLYGLRMAPIMKAKGLKRFAVAQLTIDESTGIALAQENEKESRLGFWLTGLGVFIFWNIATLAGAFGAKALGNPAAWGLDAAVPAAFLGLLWFRLSDTKNKIVAALAFLLSLALTPIAPSGIPIISTSLIAIFFGWKESAK
jgi:predicted branched-subunit amino acid permease